MKHREKYRVMYHDTDRNFNLKLYYVAKYMQETALAAFDRLEAPRKELTKKNLAFILSKISFRFDGEIKKFDDIIVDTWFAPMKSITVIRNYRIHNETTGNCVVRAASSWALIDTNEKNIVRPNVLSEIFTAVTDDEDLGFNPTRKIKIPDAIMMTHENHLFDKEVMYGDIDENSHMNNTVYFDIVENAIWKTVRGALSGKLCTLDISYNNGASERDLISIWGITTIENASKEVYIHGSIGGLNCFDAKACFINSV